MRAREKVVIFGSYAPSLVNFRGSLIEAIANRGHDVLAIAPAIDLATAKALRGLGARTREVDVDNQSLNPLGIVRTVRGLARLLRDERPGVILSYTIKPVVIGAFAASAAGIPKIVSLITGAGYAFTGGSELKRLISRAAATALYRMALRRSSAVVFQNADDERLFRDLGLVASSQKVDRVNGSGVDLDHFSTSPHPPRTAFLMVSRLLGDKGIREFAAAAKRLKTQHPEVPIHLVGYLDSSPDSIAETELRAILDSGVIFHGRLDDIRPAMEQCSVYVLPSYREGTPRSVLEAMAMGRAIITTDAPGCRDTVNPSVNGVLVAPRDVESLYRAMLHFVETPGLDSRMGSQSRKIAESKYDVRKVNAALMRIMGL
jgi:glycosyltransferase involved in cell wall biosynthesis